MRNKPKLLIVGGKGLMGQYFKGLLAPIGYEVSVLDQADWDQADALCKDVNIVMVSVPIRHTVATIERLAKHLKPDTALLDITSVQGEPLDAMLRAHTGPVMSLHPIFGNTIANSNGHLIVESEGRDLVVFSALRDDLNALGFQLKMMTASEHDHMMHFVQGIQHFSTYALGAFLKKHDLKPEALNVLASPIYALELQLMGRIFDQDASLYADLVSTPGERLECVRDFLAFSQDLLDEIKDQGPEAMEKNFADIADWMGDFTAKAQESTDRVLGDKI